MGATIRKKQSPPLSCEGALGLLETCANALAINQGLSKRQLGYIRHTRTLLSRTEDLTYRQTKYRAFLYQVHNVAGRVALLLCTIAFGLKRMDGMKTSERQHFIQTLPSKLHSRPLDSKVLHNLAGITELLPGDTQNADEPASASDLPSASLAENDGTARQQTNGDAWPLIKDSIQTQAYTIPTEQHCANKQEGALQYASVAGAVAVFRRSICDSIEIAPTRRQEADQRVCITMDFPPWGVIDCLLSMQIRKSSVTPLANALFGVKRVEWHGNTIRVIQETGPRIVGTEITLKGAEEGIVLEVFGLEPLNAIKATTLRAQEVREGEAKTECVSMILTSEGAVISLALGLVMATKIARKLDLATEI
ncbi:hypothetical protein Purlil1_11503 [Purpureocillium lilacinum]|uniref:Uncharacterized protein n=1 Tax=Purpureocillium lilacinum TaxID=33203 RepID=A0ABR0BJH4_PURLI|nr:hypothetical protein Purlil1_11503 [Purpureocillium lilacinum]